MITLSPLEDQSRWGREAEALAILLANEEKKERVSFELESLSLVLREDRLTCKACRGTCFQQEPSPDWS